MQFKIHFLTKNIYFVAFLLLNLYCNSEGRANYTAKRAVERSSREPPANRV